jgi:curved DNA-binding protein CbpA
MMDDMDRYYKILGLEPGASPEQVKEAYRDLAKVWHPDRFPNDPRLQEKAQEKLKEINLAYEYLKSHQYTPPLDEEAYHPKEEKYQEEEETVREEKSESEEPRNTYTTTYKPDSFFSRIPKWVMIVMALALIRALSSYLNAPPKPQKTQYKPPIYYPVPSKPVLPAIEPPSATEKPKLKEPITKQQPFTKPPPQAVKVSPPPIQDLRKASSKAFDVTSQNEALKESADTSQTSEEDLEYAAVKDQIKRIDKQLEEFKKTLSQPPDKVATPTHPQSSVSRNYFTIGSSKEEVLAIQGTPDRFTDNSFHYGTSDVSFRNGRVESWYNGYPRLKVRMLTTTLTDKSYFTVGSSKDEVIAVQGTPDRFTETSFHYGTSDVLFQKGRVVNWYNGYPKLKVRMVPATSTTMSYFTIGSTRDKVLAIQGTPDRFTDNSFHYGTSDVFFKHGRVSNWYNGYPKLKVKLLPSGAIRAVDGPKPDDESTSPE